MSGTEPKTRTRSRRIEAGDKAHAKLSTLAKVWVPGFFAGLLIFATFWNLHLTTQIDQRASHLNHTVNALSVSVGDLSRTLTVVAEVAACVDPQRAPDPERCGESGSGRALQQLFCFEYDLHQQTPPPELNCETIQQGRTP